VRALNRVVFPQFGLPTKAKVISLSGFFDDLTSFVDMVFNAGR
jgi:hypothetical protein